MTTMTTHKCPTCGELTESVQLSTHPADEYFVYQTTFCHHTHDGKYPMSMGDVHDRDALRNKWERDNLTAEEV